MMDGPEFQDSVAKHKANIQTAIHEAGRGLCEPLDIEAVNAEVFAEYRTGWSSERNGAPA